jgi:hypothetical protein
MGELPQIPTWGWVMMVVGAATAFSWSLAKVSPQLLEVYTSWRERKAKLKADERKAELEHEKEKLDLENLKSAPLRQLLSELKIDLSAVRAKAEATQVAHEKDRLADHQEIVRCREECAKCREELAKALTQLSLEAKP